MTQTSTNSDSPAPDSAPATWERRFRAPSVTLPHWAEDRPERVAYASNETGSFQIYAHDLASGERRQATDLAIGTTHGTITPDGEHIVWFDDRTGDEVGQWVSEPFAGRDATPQPILAGLPDGWSTGLALGHRVVAAGVSDDHGYHVFVGAPGGEGRRIHRHDDVVSVGELDHDEALLAIAHAEHGDSLHLALRVLDVRTGESRGELWDGPGAGLTPLRWAPLSGDSRLLALSERTGQVRPTVWDVATGERVDLALGELPGDVSYAAWTPDARALVVVHTHDARDEVWRCAPDGTALERVDAPTGSIAELRVRPDGEVWLLHSSGASSPQAVTAAGRVVVAPASGEPARGYDYRSWEFTNSYGERVHGFLVSPPGAEGPLPTVLLIHGGPHWLWADAWRPEVPAWVDHGFAVALVNYRGSTGYGARWRDALIGSPGFTELEDLIAGLDDLVATGVTDPARVVVSGGSWGGYLTLLALGRHPERFVAGVAVVPVADYVAAFEDESPVLQSMDRVLFGGGPEERPELFAERSPLSYVGNVRVPVLIIAGDNDSRCPIRQVHNYVAALKDNGADYVLDVFDAGHGSLVVEERVRHMRLELDFLRDRGLL